MLSDKIKNLPNEPGCYLFQNEKQEVIYVGKAKNLKKRVKSYFTGSHNKKTSVLVLEIVDFSYILTNNELEALILEANLIKSYSPKYNFKLMDDKTYPYIEITNEKHPRLIISRYKNIPPGKRLFGPYPNSESLKETVKLLHKVYPLRRCQPIGKKPCFYYHINQCLGPCAQKEVDYQPNINLIVKFLEGNDKEIFKQIKTSMEEASSKLEFEKAIKYKDLLFNLNKIVEKQFINDNKLKSCDIVTFYYNEDDISLYILRMHRGNVFDNHQIVFNYVGDVVENIVTYLYLYYQEQTILEEMILGKEMALDKPNIQNILKAKISIVSKKNQGDLYALSLKNAKENLLKYNLVHKSKFEIMQESLDELSHIFDKKIDYIESFDNSQLFGQSFVTAMIVFKEFKFNKKFYRKFTVEKEYQNEYNAFNHVLIRHYQRFLQMGVQMPDLILVDGGKIQFNACKQALDYLNLDIKLGALKKNNKHQLTELLLEDKTIVLDKNSNLYRFLLRISDEVHRFTLNFHLQLKKKEDKNSLLTDIKGLGMKRYQTLLKHFKDIEDIQNASCQDFQKLDIPCSILEKIKKKYS
ncbi:MAG: excinuclease ABC subunit C [Candidatus Phytoplasma pruni]|uniref:excinuclease ABC subunit UvrC n=1 Tax=Poinsettia branch-inducing phytoplasma TaxID=138647 RepID=UPI00035D217F|nr:excinuclease ABC subunit UvrC [Poinsettia branch-inducing phytoplasma]WEK82100.1 MAG: excinuclease ABC subunit C [Candidatus Phytoplasma pruni]